MKHSYELMLNDDESIMLEAALKQMVDSYKKKIVKGEGAPNWKLKCSAEKVLSDLHIAIKQRA
jgi:hypothetical protein